MFNVLSKTNLEKSNLMVNNDWRTKESSIKPNVSNSIKLINNKVSLKNNLKFKSHFIQIYSFRFGV